jgi:ribosomal protein S18 acetylase RimI-like enzyme
MSWPPGVNVVPRGDLTREDVVAAEAIERAEWRDAFRAADPATAAALGMRAERIGDVDVLMMSSVDILMFNRVAGLGVETPATEEILDEAIGRFRAAGVPRYFIDISPAARPILLADWIAARGFPLFNSWVKLTRAAEPMAVPHTSVRIAEIGREHAHDFGRIIQVVFGLPERMSDWASALVGRPGRRHFLAFERGKPVGAAAIYVEGEWAQFGYAAVLPQARGRGIQAALIATRVRAAHESGCRRVTMETAEDTLEKPGYSLRNARKMGFQVAYLRPNYLGTL